MVLVHEGSHTPWPALPAPLQDVRVAVMAQRRGAHPELIGQRAQIPARPEVLVDGLALTVATNSAHRLHDALPPFHYIVPRCCLIATRLCVLAPSP